MQQGAGAHSTLIVILVVKVRGVVTKWAGLMGKMADITEKMQRTNAKLEMLPSCNVQIYYLI